LDSNKALSKNLQKIGIRHGIGRKFRKNWSENNAMGDNLKIFGFRQHPKQNSQKIVQGLNFLLKHSHLWD